MSLRLHAAGFLDLPAELRLIVYAHLLPRNRSFTFDMCEDRDVKKEEESLSMRTIISTCATHWRVNQELEHVVFTECKAILSVAPNEHMHTPPIWQFNRFQRIHIYIEWYHFRRLTSTWKGMEDLVTQLHRGSPRELGDIEVSFMESHCLDTDWGGSPAWAEDRPKCSVVRYNNEEDDGPYFARYKSVSNFDKHDTSCWDVRAGHHPSWDDTWLKVSGSHCDYPIVVEILEHLLDLPPCKSVIVRPLLGIVPRRENLPRHHPQRRIFDDLYAKDLLRALELWLGGVRDGVKLPKEVSKVTAEPRLEQLAYQWRDGRLYCDTGKIQPAYAPRDDFKHKYIAPGTCETFPKGCKVCTERQAAYWAS
jgi:hypothetical protein